jgi:hypothetical protein
MIGVLLRKDPAVRTLPPLALGGGVLGALSAVTVGKLLEGDSEVWKSVLPVLVVAPLIQVLMLSWITAIGGWAGVRNRAGELQLTLPVPLRTLVGLRMLALLLVGWLPLAITAAAMLLGVHVPGAREVMLRAAGASALAWAAWVALCFAWRPARPRLDSLPAFLAISASGLGLAWTALQAPAIAAPVALLLLAVAGTAAWRGVPAVMELHGAASERTRAREATAAGTSFRGAERSLRGWIARRTLLLGRNVALLFGATFMTFSIVGDDGFVHSNLAFAIFFAGLYVANSTRVLRDVAHLPIPRTRLTRWVLLPPLIAILAGFCGILVARALDPGAHWATEVDLLRRRGAAAEGSQSPGQRLQVPGALMRPVLGLEPFVVTAPSGESATLVPEPLVPGLPLAFANPYDIAPDSSIDFVAWQLSRAVRAAYGVQVEPDELRERYLSVLDGRVIGPFFDQRFQDDHPEILGVARPGLVGWGLALIVLGWLLAGWWTTRPNVPAGDRAGWWRGRAWVWLLELAAALGLLAIVFGPFQWKQRLPGVQDSLAAALVGALGGHEWVLPSIAAVVAVLGYAWLARRLARMEVPPALKRTWVQAPE